MTRKIFYESLHSMRYWIISIITVLWLIVTFLNLLNGNTLRAIFGIIVFIVFISSLFREKFETEHNYALLRFGDVILEIMYAPGDWIILLPGFSLIQYKDDFLLSTLEQSLIVEEKECQFKAGSGTYNGADFLNTGKDSINAKQIRLNYFLNESAQSLYEFATEVPKNWNPITVDNLSGDFSQGFQKRIYILEQAQGYKDFTFENNSFFWQMSDADKRDFSNITGQIPGIDGRLPLQKIDELDTTVDRMIKFGLLPVNITVGDYIDASATDEARNAIRKTDFENEAKMKKSLANKARIEMFKNEYLKAGYGKKDAIAMATAQVAREDGDRFDYGGDNKPSLMVNTPTRGKK